MRKSFSRNLKGFTLLEILLVVAAIGILAGIVILALNPAQQLAQTRDSQRQSDVNTILNGVWQYTVDNNGILPTQVVGTSGAEICEDATCTGTEVDLTTDLVPDYLVGIPTDPQDTVSAGTGAGYYISENNGRITVEATPEEATTISVSR